MCPTGWGVSLFSLAIARSFPLCYADRSLSLTSPNFNLWYLWTHRPTPLGGPTLGIAEILRTPPGARVYLLSLYIYSLNYISPGAVPITLPSLVNKETLKIYIDPIISHRHHIISLITFSFLIFTLLIFRVSISTGAMR